MKTIKQLEEEIEEKKISIEKVKNIRKEIKELGNQKIFKLKKLKKEV